MFALTLVRHGETLHNKDNVIQGQLDVPLSSIGLEQAELLGKHLQQHKFTHVYSSDLSRAKQTAMSILQMNQVTVSPIAEDQRLRERKFGSVEGRSFCYLREASNKANQSVGSYTPPGAETLAQVRPLSGSPERSTGAVLRCPQRVSDWHVRHSLECSPSTSAGRRRASPRLQQNGEWTKQNSNDDDDNDARLEKQEKKARKRHLARAVAFFNDLCQLLHGSSPADDRENLSPSKRKRGDDPPSPPLSPPPPPSASPPPAPPTFADDLIRASLNPGGNAPPPSHAAPNVSLSPLAEQSPRKLSACGSDDAGDGGALLASVLVVSHGALLREMVRHLVEDLGCCVPGGRGQALRISPNAGLSKFTVSGSGERPRVVCHLIHDKQ
ncbi:unnamed protein product, partial [Ixodes pacificus]